MQMNLTVAVELLTDLHLVPFVEYDGADRFGIAPSEGGFYDVAERVDGILLDTGRNAWNGVGSGGSNRLRRWRRGSLLAGKRQGAPSQGEQDGAQAGDKTRFHILVTVPTNNEVPLIRLAATVMLVRPGTERGFEVLMVRRSGASHFVPDAYVFPGGTVEPADSEPETLARVYGMDDDLLGREFRMRSFPQFPAPFGPPELAQAGSLMVAALRELYEEAGVLLACDAHGAAITSAAAANERAPFLRALEALNAYADARALALFSHWITPPVYPRRYNAHFFLALASAGQDAWADTVETHDGVWIAPQRALDESELGRFTLVYPTIKHLERLAEFASVDALMQFARTKPIYSIMPDAAPGSTFSLPEDLEFAW